MITKESYLTAEVTDDMILNGWRPLINDESYQWWVMTVPSLSQASVINVSYRYSQSDYSKAGDIHTTTANGYLYTNKFK